MPLPSIDRNESTSVSTSGFSGTGPCAKARAIGPANEKLTTSAPPLLRTVRRDGTKCVFMIASSGVSGCALDRLDDAGMRPAAAEVSGERVLDLRLGRLLVLRKESRGFHDHAVDAVAALHGLFLDEGALHWMRLLWRAEAFQRDHFLFGGDGRQRHD